MRDKEIKSRPLAKRLRQNMTKAEVVLWSSLKQLSKLGYNFRRQHPIGPFVVDFAHIAGKFVVEVDGVTHASPEEVARDQRREAYLRANGWTVFRCANDDIYRDVSLVVEEITRRLPPSVAGAARRDTSPAGGGG